MKKTAQPRLISSVYGKVEHVLVVYEGFGTTSDDAKYEAIRQVFGLNDNNITSFTTPAPNFNIVDIRSNSLEAPDPGLNWLDEGNYFRNAGYLIPNTDVFEMLVSWKDEIKKLTRKGESEEAERVVHFSRWVQDQFIVLQSEIPDLPWSVLKFSFYNQTFSGFMLPLILSEGLPSTYAQPSNLYLEGGNMLTMDGHLFLGKTLIEKNIDMRMNSWRKSNYAAWNALSKAEKWQKSREFEKEIRGDFKKEMGIHSLHIIGYPELRDRIQLKHKKNQGQTWQPLFHIDLFLSLGGWSPEKGKHLVFLAAPWVTRETLAPAIEQGLPDRHDLDEGWDANFRFIQDQLHRIPNLEIEIIELPIFQSQGVWYSYNNSIVEVYDGEANFYYPSYRLLNADQFGTDREELNDHFEWIEQALERRVKQAGFQPIPITSGRFFRDMAKYKGSLNCLTKVLQRSHFTPCGESPRSGEDR